MASIDLVAGDFDGSGDGAHELAVLWSRTADTRMRVSFLTGNAGGSIAQANNATAGTFLNGFRSAVPPKLAVGDFLLDGRDQVVLVGFDGTSGRLIYELVVFGANDDPAFGPLPPDSSNIARVWFEHALPGLQFVIDEEPGAPRLVAIRSIAVAGGDLTDTAAAELVVQVSAAERDPVFLSQSRWAVFERLMHFNVERDLNDQITAISLPMNGYDASRRVENAANFSGPASVGSAAIDVAIAEVDGLPPKEIVSLRAGGSNSFVAGNTLRLNTYAAIPRLAADFRYEGVSEQTVQFSSTAVGDIVGYEWRSNNVVFSTSPRPVHRFPSAQNYTIKLTVTARDGSTTEHTRVVQVGANTPAGGGDAPIRYRFNTDPARSLSGVTNDPWYFPGALLDLAVADIDNDQVPEVLTVARAGAVGSFELVVRTVWTSQANNSLQPRSISEDGAFGPLNVLASDFDGNSLHAKISQNCRRVTENVLRTVTWQPPYFSALQADAWKAAAYGQNIGQTSGYEQRAGRYFGNSISGYIGVGVDISPFGVKVFEASIKASAGQSWQRESGTLHGYENEYELAEGAEHNGNGEALVQTERHTADCYIYDVYLSGEVMPDSELRMCETEVQPTVAQDTSARVLNTLTNQTLPVQVPAHWVPLQRDWASLSLFHPVVVNATLASGSSAAQATDGMFSTAATSFNSSLQPYLQIDLGSVRDISAIRIFPGTDEVSKLWGYRLYASEQPFVGNGVPSGPGVTRYQQDPGVEAVYREWNIWTRNPAQPQQPLRARYLRLQHPGNDPVPFSIAEIQVFGDSHSEPPAYPESVCDNLTGDGVFYAKVWNPVANEYRSIELHGDLIWSGAEAEGVLLPNGQACVNDNTALPVFFGGDGTPTVARYTIWNGVAIGGDATRNWALSANSTNSVGTYKSLDDSHQVGLDIEVGIGAGAMLLTGASYEFATGVTQESQSSTAWSEGFSVSGEISGFDEQGPLVSACSYFPRPYAFRQTQFSNGGFKQAMYVTDYTVRQIPHGSNAWQRDQDLSQCLSGEVGDVIFADGFQ